ncbi:MAG: thiamine-phosphate kinase, partial [Candidatus Bathyarchaeia archaeon]
MDTAEKLGERKIIETIWEQLDVAPDMIVPFGDDVSAVQCEDGKLLVLKTDMLIGETDVPPQMSYWQAARKAIVMNISDLAAKGAKPLGLLVSLGVPRDLTRRNIEEIGKGLNAGAKEYDTYILGGDTSETNDLVISVAAIGLAKKKTFVLRSGARQGDIVATTGLFGFTSAGIKILIEKLAVPPKI